MRRIIGRRLGGAALAIGVLTLLACSDAADTPVASEEVVIEELDVAVGPPASPGSIDPDSLASILAEIAAAREDIARGDAVDASLALRGPEEMLDTFVQEKQAAGLAEQAHSLAQAREHLKAAGTHLDAGNLGAADEELRRAEEQARSGFISGGAAR